jgi:hypothetical protein
MHPTCTMDRTTRVVKRLYDRSTPDPCFSRTKLQAACRPPRAASRSHRATTISHEMTTRSYRAATTSHRATMDRPIVRYYDVTPDDSAITHFGYGVTH